MLTSLPELPQQHLRQQHQPWILNSQEADYVCLICCAQQLIMHVMKIDSQCVLMVINFTESILISYSGYILKGKHHYHYSTQLTLMYLKKKTRYEMYLRFISELSELY